MTDVLFLCVYRFIPNIVYMILKRAVCVWESLTNSKAKDTRSVAATI